MSAPQPIPFNPSWPQPEARFLRNDLPPPPVLPLGDVLGPRLAQWVTEAAEAKGAPADYGLAALLAVAGSTIGNARWVSPWKGWTEPPIIWTMCIGLPSSGKSPAIDAVLAPLRMAEKPLRQAAEAKLAKWQEREEAAKLKLQVWRALLRNSGMRHDFPFSR